MKINKHGIIMPTTVDEKQFGIISTEDKGCKRFVCKNLKMVHHITYLRDKKVYELMLQTCKGKRIQDMSREVYDRLPSIISVDAATTSMVTSVNVLPSWEVNDVLQIEVTQHSMDLLLEEPPAEPAPWTPTIDEFWDPVNQVIEFSLDGASVCVEFLRDMDDDAKRDAVMSAAADFQERYCRFYNAENTRPGQQPFNNEPELSWSSRGVNHIYRQS